MLSGIYSAATALKTAEYQQDVIATNLAHMNVPGYRRSSLSVETFAQQLAAEQADEPGHGNTVESLVVDFSAGPMVNTGHALDVAIDGEGFFAVQGESETLYTRNGTFHLNENGVLVGAHGMPILGTGGPITLPNDASATSISIARDGLISAGANSFGQLQLVHFEDNTLLQPYGTTLFAAGEANISNQAVAVVQGVREQSNVTPVDELVSMIVATRYHEAAQRTLKTIGEAIQKQTDPRS